MNKCPKCDGVLMHYSHGFETEDGEYDVEHEWECDKCSYLIN
jgi:hypothetical protein